MLSCLDYIREVNFLSIVVRLVLAMLCGGMIGMERSFKRRPAGFRTHVLVCLGAAMTTLTSQYLYLVLHLYTDMARLGAQVIAGIGFIGAGTIIVTRHRRVKGLTTAAGLWSAAIVGLACGAGYYEGAVLAAVFILLAELVFSRVEERLMGSARDLRLLIRYEGTDPLNQIIQYVRDFDLSITGLEISKDAAGTGQGFCVALGLQIHRKIQPEEVIRDLAHLNGVAAVEQV